MVFSPRAPTSVLRSCSRIWCAVLDDAGYCLLPLAADGMPSGARRKGTPVLRVPAGFCLGCVLAATLNLVAGEASLGLFFAEPSGLGSPAVLVVAASSALAGTTLAQSFSMGVPLVATVFSPALIFVLFALFGGVLVYARRRQGGRGRPAGPS